MRRTPRGEEAGLGQDAVLVVVGGLPGSGKTTIGRSLAQEVGAAYVRIDTIEAAIDRAEGPHAPSNGWVDAPGYLVGHGVAVDQLSVGLSVVAEAVNALEVSRDAWRAVAHRCGALLLEMEILCSDVEEHQRRVESREPDIPGLVQPTWFEVLARPWEPWMGHHLVVDSSQLAVDEAVAVVLEHVDALF